MADQHHQFDNEQDLRNVIRLLLRAYKRQQVRAATLNKILSSVMELPPAKRAALTASNIDALVKDIRPRAGDACDLYSEQIEQRLKNGDFLNALRTYASQQLWLIEPYKDEDVE